MTGSHKTETLKPLMSAPLDSKSLTVVWLTIHPDKNTVQCSYVLIHLNQINYCWEGGGQMGR